MAQRTLFANQLIASQLILLLDSLSALPRKNIFLRRNIDALEHFFLSDQNLQLLLVRALSPESRIAKNPSCRLIVKND